MKALPKSNISFSKCALNGFPNTSKSLTEITSFQLLFHFWCFMQRDNFFLICQRLVSFFSMPPEGIPNEKSSIFLLMVLHFFNRQLILKRKKWTFFKDIEFSYCKMMSSEFLVSKTINFSMYSLMHFLIYFATTSVL